MSHWIKIVLFIGQINRIKIYSAPRSTGLHICHEGHRVEKTFLSVSTHKKKKFCTNVIKPKDHNASLLRILSEVGKKEAMTSENKHRIWLWRLLLQSNHSLFIIYEPMLFWLFVMHPHCVSLTSLYWSESHCGCKLNRLGTFRKPLPPRFKYSFVALCAHMQYLT